MEDKCPAICPRISDRQMVCVYVIHTICPMSEWFPCGFLVLELKGFCDVQEVGQ